MIEILANRDYRRLFCAQVVALLGTGLATVALGLLAFDLAGEDAAAVLAGALTLKMIAYVVVAPVATALVDRLPRRAVLIALDGVRAATALALPFVSEIWQIYGLIFLLQAASAAFTPIYQAAIPDILTDQAQYARGLALSRLAYDLENILSPLLAALLLTLVPFSALFLGTAAGFAASGLLILAVALPRPRSSVRRGVFDRMTRGVRIFFATPRLQGLLALNAALALGGAMALVNTVLLVRGGLALGDTAVAIAMAAFGGGSILAALTLPRLMDRWPDRRIMVLGAAGLSAALLGFAAATLASGLSWSALLVAWAAMGLCAAAIQTPVGVVLARSAHAEDRPALFAAQFALSHACWLVAYPLAGALMTTQGAATAAIILGGLAGAAAVLALRRWPIEGDGALEHRHDDLPPDHPHLADAREGRHTHRFVIDDLHLRWPDGARS